ncbi:MAG: DNA-binding domain-containing protein [Thiohalocapsa sp.]
MGAPDPTQAGFAAALLAPEQPVPPGLIAWNGSDPAVRFGVYRNNVAVSLTEALAEGFPVTRALVGDAFFEAMARCFVTEHSPCSPILTDYGDAFPDFIAAFLPAAGLPYLPDMAHLERARVRAYHAADAQPLTADDLTPHLADPQRLPATRVVLHPACTVLASEHAVVSLWAAHQGQCRIEDLDLSRAEAALVLRDGDEVQVVPVSTAIARFLAALAGGTALGDAAAATNATAADFDLVQALALLIHHGGIAAWHPPGDLA